MVLFASGGNPILALSSRRLRAPDRRRLQLPAQARHEDDAIWLATGIFVSIINIFLSLLNLFSD